VALLLFWPASLLGQVTGRFYFEKDTHALGEPVFLYFEATNSETETENVNKADPYSFCSHYFGQPGSEAMGIRPFGFADNSEFRQ
jgi:hypothetical protein